MEDAGGYEEGGEGGRGGVRNFLWNQHKIHPKLRSLPLRP